MRVPDGSKCSNEKSILILFFSAIPTITFVRTYADLMQNVAISLDY